MRALVKKNNEERYNVIIKSSFLCFLISWVCHPHIPSDPATKEYVDGKTNKYENGYYVGTGTTKVFNFNNKPIAIFMFNAYSTYLSFGFIGLSSLLDMSSIQIVGDISWSDNKITISYGQRNP